MQPTVMQTDPVGACYTIVELYVYTVGIHWIKHTYVKYRIGSSYTRCIIQLHIVHTFWPVSKYSNPFPKIGLHYSLEN